MKVKFPFYFQVFFRAFQHEETSANAAHNQWNLENSQSPLHRLKLPSSGAVGKHVALLRCSVYQTIIFLYYKPANFCRLVSLKNRLAFFAWANIDYSVMSKSSSIHRSPIPQNTSCFQNYYNTQGLIEGNKKYSPSYPPVIETGILSLW